MRVTLRRRALLSRADSAHSMKFMVTTAVWRAPIIAWNRTRCSRWSRELLTHAWNAQCSQCLLHDISNLPTLFSSVASAYAVSLHVRKAQRSVRECPPWINLDTRVTSRRCALASSRHISKQRPCSPTWLVPSISCILCRTLHSCRAAVDHPCNASTRWRLVSLVITCSILPSIRMLETTFSRQMLKVMLTHRLTMREIIFRLFPSNAFSSVTCVIHFNKVASTFRLECFARIFSFLPFRCLFCRNWVSHRPNTLRWRRALHFVKASLFRALVRLLVVKYSTHFSMAKHRALVEWQLIMALNFLCFRVLVLVVVYFLQTRLVATQTHKHSTHLETGPRAAHEHQHYKIMLASTCTGICRTTEQSHSSHRCSVTSICATTPSKKPCTIEIVCT